jgi:hypothetical protein
MWLLLKEGGGKVQPQAVGRTMSAASLSAFTRVCILCNRAAIIKACQTCVLFFSTAAPFHRTRCSKRYVCAQCTWHNSSSITQPVQAYCVLCACVPCICGTLWGIDGGVLSLWGLRAASTQGGWCQHSWRLPPGACACLGPALTGMICP